MDADVKQLLLGFQSQVTALSEQLKAKDAQLAVKDEQNRVLMEMVVRIGGQAPGAAPVAPTPAASHASARGANLTCSKIWDDYYKTIEDHSWAKDRRSIMKAPLAHFGDVAAQGLRRSDWTYYRDHVRKKQTTRSGATPSVGTRNLELVCFKVMLNWAVDQELIEVNQLARMKKERGRPARETVIGDEGLERLLSKSCAILRAFILTAIDSGMRKNEVRHLRWDQIDDQGRAKVSWTVAKTKRSRSVRLSERAIEALESLPRSAFSQYVFVNPVTNKPFGDTYFWDRFRDACTEANLQAAEGDGNVHAHDLRHSNITRTIQNGTPLAVAMRAAGHVTLRQASRYIHVDETDLDIMKDVNDKAIAAGPRRNPHRPHAPSIDRKKIKSG